MEENDCHQIVIAYKTYRRVHRSRRCCKIRLDRNRNRERPAPSRRRDETVKAPSTSHTISSSPSERSSTAPRRAWGLGQSLLNVGQDLRQGFKDAAGAKKSSKVRPVRPFRHASIRIGNITAMLTFVILGGGDLFVQWIAGYASPAFMLGTLLISLMPNIACNVASVLPRARGRGLSHCA